VQRKATARRVCTRFRLFQVALGCCVHFQDTENFKWQLLRKEEITLRPTHTRASSVRKKCSVIPIWARIERNPSTQWTVLVVV